MGWRPAAPSRFRSLVRDLAPSLGRGAVLVALLGATVLALVRRAFDDLDRLVEEQYQVQQAALARHARDRFLDRLEGVVDLAHAARTDAHALQEPWFAEPVHVVHRIYRLDGGGAVVTLIGPPPGAPTAAAGFVVLPGAGADPALLRIAVPDDAGAIVADVDLVRLGADTVGSVERYMSGYPWVVDAEGHLLAAPNAEDLGTTPFASLDGPAHAEFQAVFARMLTVERDVVDAYGWPDDDGVSRRRIAASTTGTFLGRRLLFAVSADAGDVTRLVRRKASSLVLVGVLLAAGVGLLSLLTLVHRVRLGQRERAAVHRSIASLARAMEARDPYTRGHSENVAYYAARLAECMGFDPDVVTRIYTGGLLHDLGKIGIPDCVLNKPAALDPAERETMHQHPCVGHRILAEIESLHDVVPVVRHHHERMDGSGYPDGLAGEAIPLEARIVAVADVLDALTTDRPYRAGMELAEALRILRGMRGTHLDATVVDALHAHVDAIWDPLRVAVPTAVREVGRG